MNSEENFYHNRLPENDQITNMNSGSSGNMNYNNSNSSSSSNSNSNGNGRGDRDYDSSGRNYNNNINNFNSNNSNNNNPTPHSMIGIGNPHFNTNNTEKTWMQIAREKASNVGANVSAGAIGLSSGSSNPTKWLSNISTQRYKQSADDGRGSNLISSTSSGGGNGNKMYSDDGQYTIQGIGNNSNSSNSSSSSSSNGDNNSNKYPQNSPSVSSAYTPYSSGTAPSYASPSSSAFVRRSTADTNMINNRQFESGSGPESYGIPGKTTTFGLSSGSKFTGGLITPTVSAIGKGGTAASDGEYERALVTSLCEPGGLKAVPTESSINTFHQKIVNLSAHLIGDSLVEQFNSDHWQSRNKALSVVESFCNPVGSSGEMCPGLDDHVAWWRTVESMCTLQSMTSDSKASVRSQALKTLNAIVLYKSATPTSSSLSSSPISITANHTGSTGGSAVDNSYANNQPPSLLDNDSYSSTSLVEDEVEVEVEVLIEESLLNMEDLEPQITVLSHNQQQQQQQRNISVTNQQKFSNQNNSAQPSEDYLQKERDEIALLLDMDDEYNERKNITSNVNNDYTRTIQNVQSVNTKQEISIFGQMTVNKQQSNCILNNSQNAYSGMMPTLNHDYGILDLADSANNNISKSAVTNNQYVKNNVEIDMFAGLNLSSKPLNDNHHLQQSYSSTSTSLPLSPSSSSSLSSTYEVSGSNPLPLPSSSLNTLLNPTDSFSFLSSNIQQSHSQSQSQSQLLSPHPSQFSQSLISTLQSPSNQILNTANNVSSHGTNTYTNTNTMNGIGTGFGLTPLSPLNYPQSYTNTNTQHNTQHTITSPTPPGDSMPVFQSTTTTTTTTGLNLSNGTKPLQVPFFLQSNSGTTVTSSSNGINGINKVQDSSHYFIQNKNNMNVMNKNYDCVGVNNSNLGLNNGNNGNFNNNNGQYYVQQTQNQQGDDRIQNTNPNLNRMAGHINGTPGMMNTFQISRDTQNAISTSFSTSTSTQPALKDDSFSFLSDVLKNPNSVPVPQTKK